MDERKRLKKLALSRDILSQNPAKVALPAALGPSKTVMKHHGKDILKKSQRKNRYLFSFPGQLSHVSGGKIGELKDLGTKNPLLYLEFPQGRMKLFGTIVYPKNRYLTLQFSKGGKNVTCDDYFDNMIVFSDAWWIGTQDTNPEESRLQFPKDLNLEKSAECDFKGGIGVPREIKSGCEKSVPKYLEQVSPNVDLENDLTDSPNDSKELLEVTPRSRSTRNAGKKINFVEASSGDHIIGNDDESSQEVDEKVDIRAGRNSKPFVIAESSRPVVIDVDNEDEVKHDSALKQRKRIAKSKNSSSSGHSSLVQTTLSTLFKKVEDKVLSKKSRGPTEPVLASEPSEPDDSSQDIESSDEDWKA